MKHTKRSKRRSIKIIKSAFSALFILAIASPEMAFANTGTSVSVISSGLTTVIDILTGTIGTSLGVIMFICGGIMFMIGRNGDSKGINYAAKSILGTAVIFGAAQIFSLFNFSGALI